LLIASLSFFKSLACFICSTTHIPLRAMLYAPFASAFCGKRALAVRLS